MVFDTRKQQSGWVMFQNVKVYQIVTDGALVNSTPNDDSTIVPILVRNLPATVGDSDYISFVGLPDGTRTLCVRLRFSARARENHTRDACAPRATSG